MRTARLLFRALVFMALTAGTLAAANWKIVLKDGRVVVCDAPPIVIDGTYLFRYVDGTDGSLSADEVDPDQTARLNKTTARPKWREIGHSEHRIPGTQERASGAVVTLDDSNFASEVLRSRVPVLVDFWATWCGPCRVVAPAVDAIAARFAGRVKVGRLDVDQAEATADRCGIHAYPTLMLFKNGVAVSRVEGAVDRETLARMIEASL